MNIASSSQTIAEPTTQLPTAAQNRQNAAAEWAEFLYAEYMREKDLPSRSDDENMKEPTNHDKFNQSA